MKEFILKVVRYVLNIKMFIVRFFYIRAKGEKIYLIGVPTHGNLGDQAIVIAEINNLKKWFPRRKIIQIEEEEGSDKFLCYAKYISKNDIIFFHGGGNFGDYYLENEISRRKIIEFFSSNIIVFFPQTIHFEDTDEMMKSVKIYKQHSNLHIVLREKESFDICTKYFSNNIYLCPDIVFSLFIPDKVLKIRKNNKIFLCLRKDFEKKINNNAILKSISSKNYTMSDTVIRGVVVGKLREFFVYKKLKEISTSSLLITDRLHGMIFGFLVCKKTIVFSNFNHKIRSTFYSWLSLSKNIEYHEDDIFIMKNEYLIESDEELRDNLKLQIYNTYEKIFGVEFSS
ncbi:MAG: polysaccharide pyruvyl transferase family protein [Bacilli bacterium]